MAIVNNVQQGWPYFLSVLVNGATDYVQIFWQGDAHSSSPPTSPPTSSSQSIRKERRHCWCPPGCENLVTASPFHQQDPSALITSASRPLRSYHLILFTNTIIIYITILIITILQSVCFKTSPRCLEVHRSRLTTLFHPNQPHLIKVSFHILPFIPIFFLAKV